MGLFKHLRQLNKELSVERVYPRERYNVFQNEIAGVNPLLHWISQTFGGTSENDQVVHIYRYRGQASGSVEIPSLTLRRLS